MSDDRFFGKVSNAKLTRETPSHWKHWFVTFEDGASHKVLVPPDLDFAITAGIECGLIKGSYDSWVVDRDTLPDDVVSSSNGKAPKGGTPAKMERGRKGTNKRDDYWEKKFWYEIEFKDPQLAWQGYFKDISAICAAGVGAGEITTQEGIDLAISRSNDLYAERHPEPDSTESSEGDS